ncbi:hypothetical protein FRC01_000253 [Tulasnella sp. 417]|nr:hypothetical protein FRC01_000253 [Tulasnella sp. 417]
MENTSQRSMSSHIHHLPPEVLAHILMQDYNRTYSELFSLRSVCKFWLDVVDKTPQLWTRVSLSHNNNLLSLILKNSKSLPLSVHYNDDEDWETGGPLVPMEKITSFLIQTAPSVSRWESLRYVASYGVNHDQILGLPLQNLQRLDIALTGNIAYKRPLNAPRLKEICVHRCSLDWGSTTGLRRLEVDQNTEGPTVEAIKNVLKASPDIEILRIARTWLRPDVPADSRPIYLPKLRTISLSKVPIKDYSHLLNLIVAPSLQDFYFHFTNKGGVEDFTPMFEAAGRHIGASTENGQNYPSQLSISSKECILCISAADRKVDLQNFAWLDGDERPGERLEYTSATLSRFSESFCNSIRTVALYGDGSGEVSRYCHLVHSFFPNVADLSVTGWEFKYPDAKAVLETLGTPSDSEKGRTWLLPKLEALRFKASELCTYDDIMEMIEARPAGSQTKSIKRITFEAGRMMREVVEKLQASLEVLELVEVDL